jgi:hypothetical protein
MGGRIPDPKSLEEHRKVFTERATSLDQGRGIGPLLTALRPPGAPFHRGAVSLLERSDGDFPVARSSLELQPLKRKLRRNRLPALGSVGDLDPSEADADNLPRVMPHFSLVVVSGGNHQDMIGKPEFLKSLEEFLADHP